MDLFLTACQIAMHKTSHMPTARSDVCFFFALSLWSCLPFTASYRRGAGGDEPGRSARSLAYIGAVTCVFGAGRQTGNLSIVLRINTPSECMRGAHHPSQAPSFIVFLPRR